MHEEFHGLLEQLEEPCQPPASAQKEDRRRVPSHGSGRLWISRLGVLSGFHYVRGARPFRARLYLELHDIVFR